jgi:succinate dehydrogenase flavin-adding protein (antitoxin of CptAB toxin-antitoxin module)
LELDLVLERLLASDPPEEELRALDRLLELPDHELWEVASGRSERYDADLAHIVARLRAA